MRGSRLADAHPRIYRISKCVLASIFEELAAAAATKVTARRNDKGRKKGGTEKKKNHVSIDIIPPAPRLNHVDKVTYESFLHCGCSPSSPSRFADIALDGCYW